jgi:diguanylate cyclase (GGDEF)-like protein
VPSYLEEITEDVEYATQFCDVRDLLAVWEAANAAGIPELSVFDALRALPMGKNTVVLAELGDKLIYREAGIGVISLFGHDPKGKFVESLENPIAIAFRVPYRRALSTGQPVFVLQHQVGTGISERLILPVRSEGQRLLLCYARARGDATEVLRAVFNASTDAITVMVAERDASGTIVDFRLIAANSEAARRRRTEPDSLLGISFLETFPTEKASGTFERMVRAIETGEPDVFDVRMFSLGHTVERELRLAPRGDELACTTIDLSAKRAIEHQRNELFKANMMLEARALDLKSSYDSLERKTRELSEEAARNRDLEAELVRFAHLDGLTNIANRSYFEQRLDEALQNAKRNKRQAALCLIDIDHFKDINDSLGHSAGDLVLKEVADRISGTLRRSDVVGRMGGDEFAVLLTDAADVKDIETAVQRMEELVTRPFSVKRQDTPIRLSAGVAVYPTDGKTAGELIGGADVALYAAKRAGRGRSVFFAPGMREAAEARLRLSTRLRLALEKNEIVPFYQPLLDLRTGQLIGFEALARWQHPKQGVLPPASFAAAIEEPDIAHAMTQAIIRRVVEDLSLWRGRGIPDRVSVNVTAFDLRQPEFASELNQSLLDCGLSSRQIAIEVTETTVLSRDADRIALTLTELRRLGFSVALDDFGTGYASLSHLLSLPADSLKIDQSFVKDVVSNAKTAAIIRSIVTLAAALNLDVVAEGIETRAQLDAIRSLGCNVVQGFLIAEAMPAADVAAFSAAFAKRPNRGRSSAA